MQHFTALGFAALHCTCIFYDVLGFAAAAAGLHRLHFKLSPRAHAEPRRAVLAPAIRPPSTTTLKASADGDLGDETEAEQEIHMDMQMHGMHTHLCAR